MEQHHKIEDKALFEDDYNWYEGFIIELLAKLSETNKLGSFLNYPKKMIFLSAALNKNTTDKYIKLASSTINGLYKIACNFSDKIEIDFENEVYSIEKLPKFSSRLNTSYDSYIEGLYIAILAKDQDCLDTLLNVSIEQLDEFSEGFDPFFRNYAIFLKAVLLKEDNAGDLILTTIKSSFPDKITSASYDFIEVNHIFPTELWVKLMSRNTDDFQETLNVALTKYKEYWSSNKKLNKSDKHSMKDKPEGYLSIPLSAICQIASDNKLDFKIKSDYLLH